MTNQRTLSVHQEHEVLLALERAGITADEAQAIIGSPDNSLATWLLEQYRMDRRCPYLFVSLKRQLENLRRWNQHFGWGFARSEFDGINTTPTDRPSLSSVDLLFLVTEDSGRNPLSAMTAAWRAVAHEFRVADSLRNVVSENAELANGTMSYGRGIYRASLNLVEDLQGFPKLVDDQQGSAPASFELLWAAAHFPAWAKALGTDQVPEVALTGLKFKGHWLCLTWLKDTKELCLRDLKPVFMSDKVASPRVIQRRTHSV